jgi:hypothetical protein
MRYICPECGTAVVLPEKAKIPSLVFHRFDGMSDDEVRQWVKHCGCGHEDLACEICRKCGCYYSSSDGNLATAKVVEGCSFCSPVVP